MHLKIYCRSWQGYQLLTIQDVTEEISLLRRSEIHKKELLAKNVLLEHSRRRNAAEQDFMAQLMDYLPDALLVVDETYRVERKNSEADKMFTSASSQCFTLVGRTAPCPDCPARHGFARAAGQKKSHEIDGRIVTEIFSAGPNRRGGLLLFRDNTRQVQLISQIREHREEIASKNQLLSLLVDFGTYLQQENDGQEVALYFLHSILPVLHQGAAAILVHNTRPGVLWISQQRGIEATDFERIRRSCLTREFSQEQSALLPSPVLPWSTGTQLPLAGSTGRRIGLVILEGDLDEKEKDMLKLVLEPLGAYFQNQILLRQLEDEANTDGLTGLFNRSYLNKALEEEQAKFNDHGTPYSLVLADVNQLKKLNDEHGHEAGDRLIVAVAQELKTSLRPTDIVARTGGDEFVLLMANCPEVDAGHFVQRLKIQVFRNRQLELDTGEKFPITLSLGWAGIDACGGEENSAILLKEADKRMYADKQQFYQEQRRYR
ncbi:sensor domain-containing diguanylate cyclase [Desulfurivibrio alkaliphilus]|nr:GGDEF domain-containing protein [Desulfurivibrio alkaliphilus]